MADLPPGSTGLPLLGETLDFAKGPFRFIDQRVAKYGPVFKTSVMFGKTAVLVGPEATSAFMDEANVAREGAMPPHFVEIFGHGAVNQLDDAAHRERKAHILAAMTPAALAHYLPEMRAVVRRFFARWREAGEAAVSDEGPMLALSVVGATIHGVTDEATLASLRDRYLDVAAAFTALPIDLPGTTVRRAKQQRDAIFEVYRPLVAERRAHPGEDGLSRLLASEFEGRRLDDETAVMELHHLVLAGIGVFAFLVWGTMMLHEHPELRGPLEEEARALPADPDGRTYLEAPLMAAFVQEVRRTAPVLSLQFGRARRDFEVGGYRIPEGWKVFWAILASNNSPASAFDDPKTFDPTRFGPERDERKRHPAALTPQGMVGSHHQCAGIDFATLLCHVYFTELCGGPWAVVPDQNLKLDWSGIPPVPRDGLRVRFG